MNLYIINESKSFPTATAVNFAPYLQKFVGQVSTGWGVAPKTVSYSSKRVMDGTSFNVCIVDTFPNPAMKKALGYHEFVNGQAIAYIRADAFKSRNPFGFYLKPLIIAKKQIHGAIMSPGVFSVVCHEVAEMLIDPKIDRLAVDAKGRSWIMEICDHTVGQYPIFGSLNVAVAPDFTLPAFYNLRGLAPFSYLNVPTAPATLVKGAYGFYKNGTGILPL